jgi:hypothetical protein
MVGGDPPCVSRAMRHIFTWKPFPGGKRYFSLIDVKYDGVPGELVGSTGEDDEGRQMELKITDYQIGNPHPVYSETGIGYLFTLSLPDTFDWHIEWFFPQEDTEFSGPAPVSISHKALAPCKCKIQEDDFDLGSAWEALVGSPIEWYTFSECVLPDGEEFVFLPGFAEFNGTDSYIALTDSVGQLNVPFVLRADIRRRGFPHIWPIFGVEGTGGFFGMDFSQIIFGNLTLDTDWIEVDDVFFEWEYRFEQDAQLHHQLFIDGVEVMDRTTNRQFLNPNVLGVFRHNSFPTIWGHFDMKNLILKRGTPGNFDIVLKMPLIVDATDHSSHDNHGTTFNMDLPSVE